MVMVKYPNKVEYYRKKLAARKPEIERKLLNVGSSSVETKFEQVDAIEVFRGSVDSFYFNVDAVTVVEEFGLPFTPDSVRFGSGGSFIRLRKMIDSDGTEIYVKETRIDVTNLGLSGTSPTVFVNFERPEGDFNGVKCSKDYGVLLDRNGFYELGREYLRYRELREVEEKTRLSCVLSNLDGFEIVEEDGCRYIPGLEFSLDHILKASVPKHGDEISLNPYLELEADSIERYLGGINAFGFDFRDFRSVGARTLIL